MNSHKEQGFQVSWAQMAGAFFLSVLLGSYLAWRQEAGWPLLLPFLVLLGILVNLWRALKRLEKQHRHSLQESSQELQRLRDRLSAIFRVADALSEAVELPELLGQGLERAVEALGLEGGQIHLLSDERAEVMHVSTVFGKDVHLWDGESCIPVGACICGQVAAMGTPILVDDAINDPRLAGSACEAMGVPSVACVPLKAKGGTLGVLMVRSCDPHHFVLNDVELLSSIANYLAAAIENARIRSRMQERIAELSAEIQELAIVEERQRIGREMHDGLAQTLGLLNLQIEIVKDAAKTGDWAAAEKELARLDAYLGNAYADVREALSDLRRTASEGESFVSTLRDYIGDFGHRHGVEAVLITDNGDVPTCLPSLVEIHLQRVIQEALTNVRRHADASRVEVRISPAPQGWHLIVSDNGVGFDAAQAPERHRGRFGISTMQERVESMGGQFAIESQPGLGTSIKIFVPCGGDNQD